MKRRVKKLLAQALSVLLLVNLLPVSALAEEELVSVEQTECATEEGYNAYQPIPDSTRGLPLTVSVEERGLPVEIDWDARCANFRCAIFQSNHRGHGLGAFLIRSACAAAFDHLRLHRLELDVFAFNPRAIRAYARAGFRQESVRRQAIPDGDGWADDILMGMTEAD